MSRLPVREAIRQLSAEGLIDMIPHRGAYVSMLSRAEVQEFFDIRLRLEPWLFRLAVRQSDRQDLELASQVVAQMDTAEPEQWGRLNWQLHELLYRSAQRPAALAMVRALQSIICWMRRRCRSPPGARHPVPACRGRAIRRPSCCGWRRVPRR